MLRLARSPGWQTVAGGSRCYVEQIAKRQLRDYRQAAGHHDVIPSVEMIEAVGALGFGPVFQRTWDLYLACSEAGFRARYLDAHQLVLERGTP